MASRAYFLFFCEGTIALKVFSEGGNPEKLVP